MSDDTYYITTHEAALAVVATAMKKSRLRIDTLIITSILGGVLFSVGGMMHILVQAGFQGLFEANPAVVQLLQGSVYPIGLFYVVMMGTDLFNSNVLFFTVGVLRGAVSMLDLVISWVVSFIFNLLGSLFVVYVICHVSKSTTNEDWVKASVQLVDHKLSFSFAENMVKGIPCNFLVSMAIYLQLMVKPIHVKFLMLFTPVFVFVSMGFNHVVADMFVIPIGLLNGADCSIGKYIWKSMIPSAIGNAIGGSAFGIMIPWYLHLFVVEMDKKKLNLPQYEERDEQPEQGMDSRVVRVPSEISVSDSPTLEDEKLDSDDLQPRAYEPIERVQSHRSVRSSSALSRRSTQSSKLRPVRTRNSAETMRSPKGVFPVLGMGTPYAKERRLTAPFITDQSNETTTNNNDHDDDDMDNDTGFISNQYDPDSDKLSGNLRKILTRRSTSATEDIEANRPPAPAKERSKIFKSNFNLASSSSNNNYYNISRKASAAGLTRNAVRMSDDIAGIHPYSINLDHSRNVDKAALKQANQGHHHQLRNSISNNISQRSLSGASPLDPNVADLSSTSEDVHGEISSIDSSL